MPWEEVRRLDAESSEATRKLRQIVMMNKRIERSLSAQMGANEVDTRVMAVLVGGGTMSQRAIADRLGIKPATVLSSIRRLEALGHVMRARSPEDGRTMLVTAATSSATRAVTAMRPMVTSSDGLIADLPPDTQHAIAKYLDGVLDAMRATLDSLDEAELTAGGESVARSAPSVPADAVVEPVTGPVPTAAGQLTVSDIPQLLGASTPEHAEGPVRVVDVPLIGGPGPFSAAPTPLAKRRGGEGMSE